MYKNFYKNYYSMQKLFKIEAGYFYSSLFLYIYQLINYSYVFFLELFPLTAKMYLNFIDKSLEVFNIFMTECHFFFTSMNISKDGYFFRIYMQWKLCLRFFIHLKYFIDLFKEGFFVLHVRFYALIFFNN